MKYVLWALLLYLLLCAMQGEAALFGGEEAGERVAARLLAEVGLTAEQAAVLVLVY